MVIFRVFSQFLPISFTRTYGNVYTAGIKILWGIQWWYWFFQMRKLEEVILGYSKKGGRARGFDYMLNIYGKYFTEIVKPKKSIFFWENPLRKLKFGMEHPWGKV